ncbi:uncharacterized protein LOC134777265 [Penaeus indicus]|uniref:uncharacterized protein LOC134777265 n=1 Tax=Penaeus indicus TaxID=29960 RepID=UPI00300C1956
MTFENGWVAGVVYSGQWLSDLHQFLAKATAVNMNTKVLIFLGLAAIVAADSSESFESFESGEAKYDFNWAVNHDDSGNDFGHQEARDGDHTQGSYYVQLPDGRLQTVKYFVDGDSGYVAEVNYEGEARLPRLLRVQRIKIKYHILCDTTAMDSTGYRISLVINVIYLLIKSQNKARVLRFYQCRGSEVKHTTI